MSQKNTCLEILEEVQKHYSDHQNILKAFLSSYLVNGHVLIEGPPGTGKTTLAKLLCQIVSDAFSRFQCTADVLPQDILGYAVYRGDAMHLIRGPIFSDLLLVDEINRASSRAQSALLEAMEERQVTLDGQSHDLAAHFFVVATQNPQDYEGTFPLPEVQLDRFLLCLTTRHAQKKVELDLIQKHLDNRLPLDNAKVKPIALDKAAALQEIKAVEVSPAILSYVVDLVANLRSHEWIEQGPSIRAGIGLIRCAQAFAYLSDRNFVIPDDIKDLILFVMRHRIKRSSQAIFEQLSEEACIEQIVQKLPFPA